MFLIWLHSILCGSNTRLLREQSARYSPSVSAVIEPGKEDAEGLVTGEDALQASIEGSDIVLNSIVGSAGLRASLMCRDMGIDLALANKESLVVGGELLSDYIAAGKIIPVDSEHSTIFRCLLGEEKSVAGITLTASGGSARDIPLTELENTSPQRILRHPTLDMGNRITVDSATIVNKAFEVI